MAITCPKSQYVVMTDPVIDVSVRFVLGWSTVDLIVNQWYWNTRSVTESYVKVLHTTTTL